MKKKKIIVRVCLYLAALVFVFSGLAIVFATDSNTRSYETKNQTFLQSKAFSEELTYWTYMFRRHCKHEGYAEELTKKKFGDEENVYYTLEYNDVLKYAKNQKKAEEKDMKAVKWKQITQSEVAVRNNIQVQQMDQGSNYYYFYEDFKSQAYKNLKYVYEQNKVNGNIRHFVHLTGKQYYEILHKYAKKNTDQYLDDDEGEDVFVYVNPRTGDKVSFLPDNAQGSNYLNLTYNGSSFEYDLRDASESKDYYFVMDQLDFSSEDALVSSFITTPFTTVKNSMAFLACQEYLYEDEYDVSENDEQLNEFYYVAEFEGQTKEVSNTTKSEMDQCKDIFEFDLSNNRISPDTQAKIDDEIYAFDQVTFESLKKVAGLKSIRIGIKKTNALTTPIGMEYMRYQLSNYFVVLIILFVISILGLLIFLIFDIRMIEHEMKSFDRIPFEVRTLGISLVEAAMVVGIGALWIVSIQQCNGITIGIVIAGILICYIPYEIALQYFESVIRTIKAHQVKKNVLCICICRKIKNDSKELVGNWKISKRVLVYCIGYLFVNALCLFFMVVFLSEATPLSFLIFIFAVAFNVKVWKEIYRDMKSMDQILEGMDQILAGDLEYQIPTENMKGHKEKLADSINHISDGLQQAVAISTRDERLKAELITNVSHDIKTPLTSIINYVDLIKREHIETEPVKGYVDVLDAKSQRLKQLIEDLVEASKASTGNIELECTNLNMTELVNQTIGEFEDKFAEKELQLITDISEERLVIFGDGRRCFRIVENLFQNVYKYSMEHSRVYLSLKSDNNQIVFCLKNISKEPLNIDPEELTKRFVRGEDSRTTEGSGLGLSIAESLTKLQGGAFEVVLDGDLFKVTVAFPQK